MNTTINKLWSKYKELPLWDSSRQAMIKKITDKAKPRKRRNRARLLRIADKLGKLRHEKHYNQAQWIAQNECGTTCCIAGYALLDAGLTPAEVKLLEATGNVEECAANVLGLTWRESDVLFAPPSFSVGRGGSAPEKWPESFKQEFAKVARPSRVAAKLLRAVALKKVNLAPPAA